MCCVVCMGYGVVGVTCLWVDLQIMLVHYLHMNRAMDVVMRNGT
nr:MAG TPA: hypothetical protein [Caudoviricetes sp.]